MTTTASSGFGPLRQTVFAVLWVATIIGNIGSFARDIASSWLVTDLSSSPLAVAMVQAAATLPVFLLAIPAGVLSDILDRRKFLIGIQILMASVSICLLLLSATGLQTILSLVALTFVGGIGAALMGPTWQAIVPELVKKQDLRDAVALNSLGINIARAIGPALGGIVLATFGTSVTYGVDVISYLFVITALLWWKRAKTDSDELAEKFLGAFRAGLRYTMASRELHVVLLRTFLFFAFCSSVWALLPLVARRVLGGDAGFYGILLGAVGVGAIAGAFLLPTLRQKCSADGLLLLASIITASVMALLSIAPPQWLAVVALVVLGCGWIIALTTFNGVAQSILPNWVRGRSLAVYLTVFNGAMTAGSLAWGALAQSAGVQETLFIGAIGIIVIGVVSYRLRLPKGESDLLPSNHWPEPLTAELVEHDRGPVLIQIEYDVDPLHRAPFLQAIYNLAYERRRDGAYNWGITEDSANPRILLEWFMVESWAEHLRQHRRVSKADADIQAELLQYHTGDEPPKVRHFITTSRP